MAEIIGKTGWVRLQESCLGGPCGKCVKKDTQIAMKEIHRMRGIRLVVGNSVWADELRNLSAFCSIPNNVRTTSTFAERILDSSCVATKNNSAKLGNYRTLFSSTPLNNCPNRATTLFRSSPISVIYFEKPCCCLCKTLPCNFAAIIDLAGAL